MLLAEGLTEAAAILRTTEARVEETGYDNWNGGTTVWTVYLPIPPVDFSRLGAKRAQLEEQISARVVAATSQLSGDHYSVSITPRLSAQTDWRKGSPELSPGVRSDIFDGLRMEGIAFNGQLDVVGSASEKRLRSVEESRAHLNTEEQRP